MKQCFKHNTILFLSFFILHSCIFSISDSDDDDSYVSIYNPIRLTRTEFENSVALDNAKTLEETGKIYVKNNFLFINEPYKGFHVVDNTNPENPIFVKFISCPGATDLIFKGNTFYINQAVDLIAVQFNDTFSEIIVTKRIRNIFPEIQSPDGFYGSEENSVVVNWTLI